MLNICLMFSLLNHRKPDPCTIIHSSIQKNVDKRHLEFSTPWPWILQGLFLLYLFIHERQRAAIIVTYMLQKIKLENSNLNFKKGIGK